MERFRGSVISNVDPLLLPVIEFQSFIPLPTSTDLFLGLLLFSRFTQVIKSNGCDVTYIIPASHVIVFGWQICSYAISA